jgi:vitamin K-dependent gamma-carboxylase-like protein
VIGRLFPEERDTYVLGLLRVGFSTLLLVQTLKRGRELLEWGYFGDVFHMPLWPEHFVPSGPVYGALLCFQVACCLLALVGLRARPALFSAAACGLFCFFCDRLQYHNNRYELLLLALLVSTTPCDRSFLPLRAPRLGNGPRWAAALVGAQLSIVYLASSLGKLLDPDWRGGAVLLLRFELGRHIGERFLPAGVASILTQPWFAQAAALAAISNELFLAVGLWFKRTRALALWLGVMFHIGIELSAHVELFSYTMLCGYVVFVTPELRDRRVAWRTSRPRGRRLAELFRRLDWLLRFRHEPANAAQTELLVTYDRQQREHHGLAAWRELARATPLLFPLWLPLALLTWRSRSRASGSS